MWSRGIVAAVVVLATLTSLTLGGSSKVDREVMEQPCAQKLCSYDFTLSHVRTMRLYGKLENSPYSQHVKPVIFQEDGSVVTRSLQLEACNYTETITDEELDMVITGDGVLKTLMLVNGQLPGPQIVVNQGQEIEVKVTNGLVNEAVTLHWHGLSQNGSPWMDGAAGLSQLPILPGDSFTYRFRVDTSGTHFYHTHMGTQRAMGLYGPLIVLPKAEASEKVDVFEKEFLMTIQDYYHQTDYDIISEWANGIGGFSHDEQDAETCVPLKFNVDGFQNSFIPYRSGLINGRGRYLGNEHKERIKHLPLTTYKIDKNGRYKFRVTNSGLTTTFELSIDSHRLHVTSTDGSEVEEKIVDCITIAGGERYDFYIETNRKVTDEDNYWIRASTIEWTSGTGSKVIKRHEIKAILEYNPNSIKEPTSTKTIRKNKKYVILNCPYKKYPESLNIQCIPVNKLKSKIRETENKNKTKRKKKEYFLNFRHHIPAHLKNPNFLVTINGKIFVAPKFPPQMYPVDEGRTQCSQCPIDQPVCWCTHVLDIPLHSKVTMIFYVINKEADMYSSTAHPVHLHGHRFRVLETGYPKVNETTGKYIAANDDIQCLDEHCDQARWRSFHRSTDHSHFRSAPLKDTVLVPAGGYVMVTFNADNPGYWLMHCHMELHNANGMSLYLKVGETGEMPKIPSKLLNQEAFDLNMSENEDDRGVNNDIYAMESKYSPAGIALAIVSIIAVVTTSILVSVVLFHRKPAGAQVKYQQIPFVSIDDDFSD